MGSGPILITGTLGFVGAPLLKVLKAQGLDARAAELDLLKPETITRELDAVKPALVVHLAGLSHVPTCEKDPEMALRVNRDGTRLLAEAHAAAVGKARFLFASTAQVYAAAHGDEVTTQAVFTEERKIAPQNAYAKTKWEAEEALRAVAAKTGLRVTLLRFFNHTHKTQTPDFFLPHIYQQLQAGKTEIPVGNLDVHRDFGALEDLLEALKIVVSRDLPDEAYNICSGKAKHLRRLAEGLASRMGVQARFVTDPARVRKGEPLSLVGSHERLARATGWKPRSVTEDQLLDSFLR
jgi:GDP-4-dehydro-6-deoxy-D-mannose reductase